jgi:tryptophan synthase beta chain
MKEGTERLATETGAGQWGSALAFSCMMFGLKATVYMVRASYDQKPYRKMMMEAFGAEVYASPSKQTESGRKILEEDPNNNGSLGIAISEAVEDALVHEKEANYAIGSVFNHVLIHQTVLCLEAKKTARNCRRLPGRNIWLHRWRQQFLWTILAILLRQSFWKSAKRHAVRSYRSHSLS